MESDEEALMLLLLLFEIREDDGEDLLLLLLLWQAPSCCGFANEGAEDEMGDVSLVRLFFVDDCCCNEGGGSSVEVSSAEEVKIPLIRFRLLDFEKNFCRSDIFLLI